MSDGARLFCPSHTAEPGAGLLGIVNAEGTVDILARPIPLNDQFLTDHPNAERSFRFSGACAEAKCRQWQDGGCGIARMVAALTPGDDDTPLRPCALRSLCRWFTQTGAAACRSCHLVVTDGQTEAV